MALSNVALFGGAFLTPVIVGKIARSLDWEWTFYFLAIFSGVALPFLFFLVPETAFRRSDRLNTDFGIDTEPVLKADKPSEEAITKEDKEIEVEKSDSPESEQAPSLPQKDGVKAERKGDNLPVEEAVPKKVTYVQTLKLFNGRKTDENFLKLLLRPLPLFLHPGILWVSPKRCWLAY